MAKRAKSNRGSALPAERGAVFVKREVFRLSSAEMFCDSLTSGFLNSFEVILNKVWQSKQSKQSRTEEVHYQPKEELFLLKERFLD